MNIVTSIQILEWRARAIIHTAKAIELAEQYEEVKPRVELHIRQNPQIYGGEDFNIRKAMGENWKLSDLRQSHQFHRDQANLLWTAIAGENAFREMGE